MRCAAFGRWLAAHRPNDPKSPTRAAADRLSDQVRAAIANDAELPVDLAEALLAAYALEDGSSAADKGESGKAAEVDSCTSLYAAAASSAPLKLHPLAAPSVVSPGLASCYAQYRLAATHSVGDEAAELTANADRAYSLGLKGKSGKARVAAEAALEAEFQAVKGASQDDPQAGMMRLIMCQPLIQAASATGGAR